MIDAKSPQEIEQARRIARLRDATRERQADLEKQRKAAKAQLAALASEADKQLAADRTAAEKRLGKPVDSGALSRDALAAVPPAEVPVVGKTASTKGDSAG